MPTIDFYPLLLASERHLRGEDRQALRHGRQTLRHQLRGGLELDQVPEQHREWAEEWILDARRRKGILRATLSAVRDAVDAVVDVAGPELREAAIEKLISHPQLEPYVDTDKGRELAGETVDALIRLLGID